MLQCVLNFKRIETIHEGLRWFDVNRYGINITRRVMNQNSECDYVADSLGTRICVAQFSFHLTSSLQDLRRTQDKVKSLERGVKDLTKFFLFELSNK